MEMMKIPKREYKQMKIEIEILKNSKIYKRLLEFEKNISKGKKYIREDLGF